MVDLALLGEKACNCLCAKRNKTPIRLLDYRTGAIFFFPRFSGEQNTKQASLSPSRVSHAWLGLLARSFKCFLSLAWKTRKNDASSAGYQITDCWFKSLCSLVKKKKAYRWAQEKRNLLTLQNHVLRVWCPTEIHDRIWPKSAVKQTQGKCNFVNVFCHQGFQEQMMQNLSQMTDVIDPLATAAKSEPENIGHRVCKLNKSCFTEYMCNLMRFIRYENNVFFTILVKQRITTESNL